jgi:hypothetical protein
MGKISHISHGLGDHGVGHAVVGNPARDGAPKRVTPIEHAFGMTRQQTDAAGIGGMGHATATIDGGQTIVDSAAASPLAHAYSGRPDLKTGNTVDAVPGQRSRTNAGVETYADKHRHGRDMLATARRN